MKRPFVVLARIWSVRLPFLLARRLPLRPQVLLATAHATRIGGNLEAIRAEIARRSPAIPVVTIAHRPDPGAGAPLRALWRGMVAGYRLATSRLVVVDDYYFPIYVIRPRPGTTIVQTWHACGPFKKFGYSTSDKEWGPDGSLTRRVRIHANYDICLVGSQAAVPAFAEAFGLPPDRFVSDLGVPRTDLLFGVERIARTVAALRDRYAIPSGRRVVLYAPTFRGPTVMAARRPDGLDIARLVAAIRPDSILLVKQHPFVHGRSGIGPELADSVIDVSDHPEINDLLLLSDVLITDYSSVIFEFALLGRPMLFFAPDHAAYERERGLYFDYREFVPGPVFETTEALAEHLRADHLDAARSRAFAKRWFEVADGRASERFVERIVIPAVAGQAPAVSGRAHHAVAP